MHADIMERRRGLCMSRCQQCKSPTCDFNSVTFHVYNSDGDYSQWAVGLIGRPKPFKYYLNVKDMANPNGDLQVTISTDPASTTTIEIFG